MNQYEKHEEVPENQKSTIRKSMFSYNYSNELHLERSMRLLPHHNDCGGFFVAVLRKKYPLPWEKGQIPENLVNNIALSPRVRNVIKGTREMYEKNKIQKHWKRVSIEARSKPVSNITQHPNFFSFLDSNDQQMQKVFQFYDLPQKEHFVDTSLMFTPYGKNTKMYLTNKVVKDILKANVIGENRNTSLNVFYAGTKVLKNESKKASCIEQKSN